MPPKRPKLERHKTTLPVLNTKFPGIKKENTSINLTGRRSSMFLHDEDAFTYIASVEIGTAFSGYAYAERKEGKSIVKDIVMNPAWVNTDKSVSTLRAPSCLLLNEKKEFEAYGYEAESLYADLVKENKQDQWYYFRRFKPKLLSIEDIRGNSQITEENGKTMSAMKVFSFTFRYMKSQLLNDLCLRGKDANPSDIRWMITVAGFSSEHARQFMRKAAVLAGIPDDRIKICLEPEVASLFVQNTSNTMPSKLPIFKAGGKYILADIGGGLTDIVLHEKRKEGMREVSRGVGAKLGGGAVDSVFVQFLYKLLGPKIAEEFVTNYKKDFLALMGEFEVKKRTVTPRTTSSLDLRLPPCLQVLCQKQKYNDKLSSLVQRSVYKEHVRFAKQKLYIDAVVANEFFRAITIEIAKLINHSLTALKTAKDISVLVLTGGLAESEVIQEIMHQELIGKSQIKQIVVPPDAGAAVLKGAVIFGNKPGAITCRINRQTLGLRIARLYNPEMFPPKRRTLLHGVEYVLDVFSPFITIGTRVPVGFISHQALTSTEPNQKKIEIDIYHSSELGHNFTTDEGSESLGKIDYPIPMPSAEARTIFVDFHLGDTELLLIIVDKKTNLSTKYYFPMLKDK